jgi:signal transduction histidine kinase
MSEKYKIRPSGRHLLTIGRDLIQNCDAAVIELIKNAYDADSPDVRIEFKGDLIRKEISIVISDSGHGMSRETVLNNWMVPSTQDKFNRQKSPLGRIMQGRKGIGRYAASILGSSLLLETVTNNGEKTTATINWSDFNDAQFLDDVEVIIETTNVAATSGTKLTIKGGDEFLTEWDKNRFKNLQFELRKLVSPPNEDQFKIHLVICDFPGVVHLDEIIESYPILELFDYRIMGTINKDGHADLMYSCQKTSNIPDEQIAINVNPTNCGELSFDIRVYDREPEAIQSLIERGLRDKSGNYVGKLQAKELLNIFNGVSVYRNGFRIRPLGDADFDWLKLNERRVQNPSRQISSNQVIGYVQIQSEDLSNLTEKSARDGLKENSAFASLKKITEKVIAEIEARRFLYRSQSGLSRTHPSVERELEKIYSSEKLKRDVQTKLEGNQVDVKVTNEILEMINKDTESKSKVIDEIRKAVAIYQGQATLGKIIAVILHEGRRPLNYFRNEIPNIEHWHKKFAENGDPEKLEKIMSTLPKISQNSNFLVNLFKKLDPLAGGKRSAKKTLKLKKTIQDALSIFDAQIQSQAVDVEVLGSSDFSFLAWHQDIDAIFVNLCDNSLYWMEERKIESRKINIEIVLEGAILRHIDYHDTGPGIDPKFIISGVIFEPDFSTKPSGTGLGLAIAGEAASRNGFEIKAFESKHGAWFRLQTKLESKI